MIKMVVLLLVSHLSRSWRFVQCPNLWRTICKSCSQWMGSKHKTLLINKKPRNIDQQTYTVKLYSIKPTWFRKNLKKYINISCYISTCIAGASELLKTCFTLLLAQHHSWFWIPCWVVSRPLQVSAANHIRYSTLFIPPPLPPPQSTQ
jgi:hypothetical protein